MWYIYIFRFSEELQFETVEISWRDESTSSDMLILQICSRHTNFSYIRIMWVKKFVYCHHLYFPSWAVSPISAQDTCFCVSFSSLVWNL